MILSRISKAVREQNWFAVVLEFVIVIAGVVIGFQIQAWNEARAAAAREDLMLLRLHREAEQNASYYTPRVERNDEVIPLREEAIALLASGDFEGVDLDRLTTAIDQARSLPTVSPPRGVYDEIVSSGLLSTTGDDALRNALSVYWSYVDFLQGQIDYRRQLQIDDPAIEDFPFVRREFDPDHVLRIRTVIDFDAASRSDAFQEAVAVSHSRAVLMAYWWSEASQRAVALCAETARLTGQACEPRPDTAARVGGGEGR
jgi:hypothetical protein